MWKKFKNWTYKNNQSPVEFRSSNVIIQNTLFTLRKAELFDVKSLLQIEREVYDGETPWDSKAFTREIERRFGSLYLILENKRSIVAFIGLNWNQEEMHITNFAVLTAYQGQKIGRWLLNFAIDYATSLLVNKITLEVSVENQIAIHLYHAVGFEDGQIKKFYYSFNNGDAMNMELELGR